MEARLEHLGSSGAEFDEQGSLDMTAYALAVSLLTRYAALGVQENAIHGLQKKMWEAAGGEANNEVDTNGKSENN